jgi:membrane complex biogenesis BtpA family protein
MSPVGSRSKKVRRTRRNRSSGSSLETIGEGVKLPGLIGVIHLPALAGAPGASGLQPYEALARAGEWAVEEALILEKAGFQGLILENFGDAPFYREGVPPETIAALAVIGAAIRERISIPLGINVLRNDARAALAIASVIGADFIRVNVLSGVAATDQGIIEGDAAFLLRERLRLGGQIAILGDVHVKHAQSLSSGDVSLAVEEVALRAGAHGVIVTGTTTGRPVDFQELEKASIAARKHGVPLWIGSGTTPENLAELRQFADGVIVGSALREEGRPGAPLDLKRIEEIRKAWLSAAPQKRTRALRSKQRKSSRSEKPLQRSAKRKSPAQSKSLKRR